VLKQLGEAGIEAPTHIFGSGAKVMGLATSVPDAWHVPRASAIASLALNAWIDAGSPQAGHPLDAHYVRKSDAEIDAERREAATDKG